MVMLVKESQKINHLQTVSKTKVRGVLALLKHGEMLITHGNDGNPVRLYLAKGINSFRDLRERHDAFVLKYMMEHHLFMPAILKSELVWQVDEDTRSLRAEAMNKLTLSLQSFFDQIGSFSGDSIPHCDDSVLQAPRSQAHSVGPPRYTDNNGMSEHVYNRIQKDFLHSSPQQIHDFERAGVGLKNGVQPSYGYSNGQVIGNNNNPGSFYGGYRDSNGSSAIDNDGYIMRDHQRQSGLLSNMRDDKNILRSRTPLGPWHHQNPNEGISTFDQRWGDQVDNFDVSDGQTRSSRGNSSSSILTGDERIRDFVSEVSPMLPDTNYYANSVFGSLSAVSKSEGSAMGPLKLENMDFHGRSDGATITNIRQPSDLVEIPADFSPSTYNSRQRFVAYSIDPNSNT